MPTRNRHEMLLETEIIDSGIGINKERQKLLFKPFLELRAKQNLSQVQDFNIGVGLGFSKELVNFMGGDIYLNKSKKGFTSIGFKIPVNCRAVSDMDTLIRHSAHSRSLFNFALNPFHLKNIKDHLEVSKYLEANPVRKFCQLVFDSEHIIPVKGRNDIKLDTRLQEALFKAHYGPTVEEMCKEREPFV